MSAIWANWDLVRAILTVTSLIPFALFGSAGLWHFGGRQKSGTNLVSIASLVGFLAVLSTLWLQENVQPWAVLGVALQMLSVFLFGWCIGTSGKRNLSLAFSPNCSPKLMTEGPYSIVRHPFYTSYIIYWVGGAIVASSIFTVASTAILIVIYLYASRREDEFLAQRFDGEFDQWHRNTGAFFPKLR